MIVCGSTNVGEKYRHRISERLSVAPSFQKKANVFSGFAVYSAFFADLSSMVEKNLFHPFTDFTGPPGTFFCRKVIVMEYGEK